MGSVKRENGRERGGEGCRVVTAIRVIRRPRGPGHCRRIRRHPVFSVLTVFSLTAGAALFFVNFVIFAIVILVFAIVCLIAVIAGIIFFAIVIVIVLVIVVVFLVVAVVKNLAVGGGVTPPGALADGGEGAFAAVVEVLVAEILAGGQLVACGSLLRGLDGLFLMEVRLGIDETRGNPDPAEKAGGFLEVDAAIDDGVVDARDGELDGGGVFRRGQLEGAVFEVGLGAYGVDFGVVVAEWAVLEGRGLAAEPVGLDVPARLVHISSPFPLPHRFQLKS